ncbi:PilX N-terminal domain-containing pilus assembly protein [Marinobacter sp.]|uniref:pilus assembly PilX family protein n=1 Tax=Marinobacter sp. TaxID=50741 RepID=UPI0035617BAA
MNRRVSRFRLKANFCQQRGAVLVISLVILLVITLIGVAGMNSSVMQERMAANAQNANRTFQAAESSIGALLDQLYNSNLSMLRDAMQDANDLSPEQSFSVDPGEGINGTYQARYLGEIIITSGSSMDANESSTLLKGYRYELRGSATMDNTGAASTVFKGIEYY